MRADSDLLVDGLRRPQGEARFQKLKLVAVPLAALVFQVWVPLAVVYLGYLELPLLVVLYFALTRRRQIASLLYGAAVGLSQDALSHNPIGMFGIAKTLAGYFAAAASVRFDVDNPVVRFLLSFFFYFFHQFLYWALTRALLAQPASFSLQQALMLGALNGAVAVPLFHVLAKLLGRG
jgi:rod shape-determining protein MreD